jgi:hypothetical protein
LTKITVDFDENKHFFQKSLSPCCSYRVLPVFDDQTNLQLAISLQLPPSVPSKLHEKSTKPNDYYKTSQLSTPTISFPPELSMTNNQNKQKKI